MTAPVLRNKDGSYTHPLHNETYPGVSTCIGILDKPALIGWAAKMAATYAVEKLPVWQELSKAEAIDLIKGASRRSTADASGLGSEVHHAIETWIKTGARPHTSQAAIPFMAAFETFLREWDPYWILSEATVFSYEHGYAGTLDAVAELDGAALLLDIKTGKSGVWPEAALQLAAYRYAEEAVLLDDQGSWQAHPMPETTGAAVLHVRPERYQLVPLRTDQAVYEAFLHCRALHAEWRQKLEKSVVHRPMAPPSRQEVAGAGTH